MYGVCKATSEEANPGCGTSMWFSPLPFPSYCCWRLPIPAPSCFPLLPCQILLGATACRISFHYVGKHSPFTSVGGKVCQTTDKEEQKTPKHVTSTFFWLLENKLWKLGSPNFIFYTVTKDGWCILFWIRTQPVSLYPFYPLWLLALSSPRRNPVRSLLSAFILQNEYFIKKGKYC